MFKGKLNLLIDIAKPGSRTTNDRNTEGRILIELQQLLDWILEVKTSELMPTKQQRSTWS